MKIIIPGGSGQIGTILSRAFHAEGHEVVVLSRNPAEAPWRTVYWDGHSLGDWVAELDGADAVVNLAGRNVNCRYTGRNRRLIMDSRVESTRVVGQAIAHASRWPHLWLQASTATIYAHRYDAANDEDTGIIGGHERDAPAKWRFSIDVARAWERACTDMATPQTRKVLMRSAMVMSPDRGGIFDVLLWLVRFGLGGRVGDGRQYVSWIHDEDFVRAVLWLIDRKDMDGVVNLAAPNPIPYADFMQTLRSAWGVPVGLSTARWMVKVGTFVLRTEAELVLKSRRVVPARLLESGFDFRYPAWQQAVANLCNRWRSESPTPKVVTSRMGR